MPFLKGKLIHLSVYNWYLSPVQLYVLGKFQATHVELNKLSLQLTILTHSIFVLFKILVSKDCLRDLMFAASKYLL